MTENKPKFEIGDKVIVCQDLKTEIEKIEFSENYQEHIYWFKDEKGKLCNEIEGAIKLLEKSTKIEEALLISSVVNCNFKNKTMDEKEILLQAKSRLPDPTNYDLKIITVPVTDSTPIFKNTIEPQQRKTYEVRFEKALSIDGGVIWIFRDIT